MGDDTSVTMMVPASSVGRIIGKKGSKIRELEERTGTRIKINRSDDDEVRVDVQGNQAGVDDAKYLINQLTQEDSTGGYSGGRDQQRSYGSSSGGSSGGGGYGSSRSRDQGYDSRGGGGGYRSYSGSGGYRSRDSNDRGGDRNCYNCGEPGHISRNCPG